MTRGGCSARMVPISGHGDLEVGQDLQQVRLELLVGAVDLVDQQHRRRAVVRLQRLEQRPLDQELGAEDVVRGWPPAASPRASSRRISSIWRG